MAGRAFSSRTNGELAAGLATALLAAVAVFALSGFTVDDAWIPARYAAHLRAGQGYRFNIGGPSTDGVTPLPFAPLLALVAPQGGIVGCWKAARFGGALAWLTAAGLLGAKAFRSGARWQRFVPLLVVAVSGPLAAWSVAGLETGLVTLLATVAVTSESAAIAAGAVGLAAAFRPEMAIFAGVIGIARAFERPDGDRSLPVLLALGPWFLVYALRVSLFGRGTPLSLLAKPADLGHGIAYVVAGALLVGAPVFAWAPVRLAFDPPLFRLRWLVIGATGHFGAVALAGGDWMPLSRLLVPVLPALLVVGFVVAERASTVATLGRALLAVAVMTFALARVGLDARGVVATRAALIQEAKPILSGRRAVATLDIGWVSVATSGTVVDLAGLTDPAIAVLPGGHTSKRIPATLLAAREVDTLVLLRRRSATEIAEDGGPYERSVEVRMAQDPWVEGHFTRTGMIASGPLQYVVFSRREVSDTPPP